MHGTGAAGASYGDLLVTSLLVLGAVCIAAFLAVRFFGRVMATGRARGQHLLDVVARVPLEPRRSLYVVEVAGKTLLVGTSEMGLSVLSELDGSEVKARVSQQQTFADLVRSAWRRRTGLAGTAPDRSKASTADVSAETRQPPATARPPGDVSADTRQTPATDRSPDRMGEISAEPPASPRVSAARAASAADADTPSSVDSRAADGSGARS